MEIRALDLTPAGLDDCVGLLRLAMPIAGHLNARLLHWQYAENPAGRALGLNVYDQGRLVCHCVVQPLEARLFGIEARGVMSMNAATHPSYHGRGLYFSLAQQIYAQAQDHGYEFGVAVTNDASTSGFINKVGFELLRPLEVRLGLGGVAGLEPAARASSGTTAPAAPIADLAVTQAAVPSAAKAKENTATTDAATHGAATADTATIEATAAPATAAEAGAGLDLQKVWSPQALAWRLASPLGPYRAVRRPSRVRVFAPARKAGVEVLLGDFDPELFDAATALLHENAGRDTTHVTLRNRAPLNPVKLWAGIDPACNWARSAYLPLPNSLRPSPLNLIFKDLGGSKRKPGPNNIKWLPADFDDF